MEATPLKGLLADESDDEVSVDVVGGTWIIKRADLEDMREWTGGREFADSRRPVELVIRPGAKISLVTTFTVEPLVSPLTRPEYAAAPVNSDDYAEKSEEWGRSYGFDMEEVMAEAGGNGTVCCWDEGGTHGVCKRDDCG